MYKLGIFGVFQKGSPRTLRNALEAVKKNGRVDSEDIASLKDIHTIISSQENKSMERLHQEIINSFKKETEEMLERGFAIGGDEKNYEAFKYIAKILGKKVPNSLDTKLKEEYPYKNNLSVRLMGGQILVFGGSKQIGKISDGGSFVPEKGKENNINSVNDNAIEEKMTMSNAQYLEAIKTTYNELSIKEPAQFMDSQNKPEKITSNTQGRNWADDIPKYEESLNTITAWNTKVESWTKGIDTLGENNVATIVKMQKGEIVSKADQEKLEKAVNDNKNEIPQSLQRKITLLSLKDGASDFDKGLKGLREVSKKITEDISKKSFEELMKYKKELVSDDMRILIEKYPKLAKPLKTKLEEVNQKLNDPNTERVALNNANNDEKITRENTLKALKKKFTKRTQVREFQQKLQQFLTKNNMPDYLGATAVDGLLGNRTATAVMKVEEELNKGRATALNTEQIIGSIQTTSIDQNVQDGWRLFAQFQKNFESHFSNKRELQKALNTYITNNNLGSEIAVDGQVGPQTRGAIQKVFNHLHKEKPDLDADKMIAELEKGGTTTT